jgi:hypothetical protein
MIIVYLQGNSIDFYVGVFESFEKFTTVATVCKKEKYRFEIETKKNNVKIKHYIDNFLFSVRNYSYKQIELNEFTWFVNGTKDDI